jgi:hypothetical protein
MLNRIIRLQAVVKIITNETTTALNLLAKPSTKMRNAVYQKCLALDYLLASEGGVYEKFNLNNCCLQTEDKEKVTNKIKKIAMSPSRLGEDGIPMTCLEDGFLPWADLKP